MNDCFVRELKRQLDNVNLGKHISDESAYHLYQISNLFLSWVLEICKPKLTRYLLHAHGIQPMENYDPQENYDPFDDELPF